VACCAGGGKVRVISHEKQESGKYLQPTRDLAWRIRTRFANNLDAVEHVLRKDTLGISERVVPKSMCEPWDIKATVKHVSTQALNFMP
jgi:hypothetical protein